MKRTWTDAKNGERCNAVITLSDKTTADCGRKVVAGEKFCWQHLKAGAK